MGDLRSLLTSMLMDATFLIIYAAGGAMCLVRWQRHPRCARLALCAFVLFAVRLVMLTFVGHWLRFRLGESEWDYALIATYASINRVFGDAISIVAWTLLLVALFRRHQYAVARGLHDPRVRIAPVAETGIQAARPSVADPTPSTPTERELRAFVGGNADDYLEAWWPALIGQGRASGFNIAGCLLGGWWLAYRKMYKGLLLLACIILAVVALQQVLLVGILRMRGPALDLTRLCLDGPVALTVALVTGIYGSRWYLSQARRVIAHVRDRGLAEDAHLRELARRGGTNVVIALGLVLALMLAGSLVSRYLADMFGRV
jgi:hypothetical protein